MALLRKMTCNLNGLRHPISPDLQVLGCYVRHIKDSCTAIIHPQESRNRTLAVHEPVDCHHFRIIIIAGSRLTTTQITEYNCVSLL